MRTIYTSTGLKIALIAVLVITSMPIPVSACTRVLYVAKDSTVITGRSMDWGEDLKSNMWVLPRGISQYDEDVSHPYEKEFNRRKRSGQSSNSTLRFHCCLLFTF